jgi:pectate lyase
LKGISYVVTNDEDDHKKPSPGSLRYGVHQGGQAHGGVWITFARSFVITLTDLLWVKSGTTIDGRGSNITITGLKNKLQLISKNLKIKKIIKPIFLNK